MLGAELLVFWLSEPLAGGGVEVVELVVGWSSTKSHHLDQPSAVDN